MKKYVIGLFSFLFLLPVLLTAQTQTSAQVLLPGESIQVTCNTHLIASYEPNNATLSCVQVITNTATATITPTITNTSTPIVLTYIPTLPTYTPSPITNNDNMWAPNIESLPMSGTAWEVLKNTALSNWGNADLSDQDSNHDQYTLAGALYYVRTKDTSMRTKVITALQSIPETENGGRTLALGRNLVGYVIAADLVDYNDTSWKQWLYNVRTEMLDGRTLISTHEQRPNNWGTHAGASRIAADIYLNDTADLARAAKVFHGWLGNRSEYNGFVYGDLSWQCDSKNPVGINPSPCIKNGLDIGGALPDDMRRGSSFKIPPAHTGYAWGGIHGAVIQAELLSNAGYDAWNWQNKALLRATNFLKRLDDTYGNWWAEGDDRSSVHLINAAYNTTFSEEVPAGLGKSISWTDYTH